MDERELREGIVGMPKDAPVSPEQMAAHAVVVDTMFRDIDKLLSDVQGGLDLTADELSRVQSGVFRDEIRAARKKLTTMAPAVAVVREYLARLRAINATTFSPVAEPNDQSK